MYRNCFDPNKWISIILYGMHVAREDSDVTYKTEHITQQLRSVLISTEN